MTARKVITDEATGIRTRNPYGPTWAERDLRKSPERDTFPLPGERLLITARNHGRYGATMFDAYLTTTGDAEPRRVVITTATYWSDARDCYHVTASGTSRTLEILLDIGAELGYSFAEIAQGRRVEL